MWSLNETRCPFALLCAALLLGGGCGEEDKKDEGTTSGVPSETSAAELTDEQAQTLCVWLEDIFQTLVPNDDLVCTIRALTTTEDEAGCEAERKACNDAVEEGTLISVTEVTNLHCEDYTAETIALGCEATVGEIEACYENVRTMVAPLLGAVSCEQAGGNFSAKPPEACAILSETCPLLSFTL